MMGWQQSVVAHSDFLWLEKNESESIVAARSFDLDPSM